MSLAIQNNNDLIRSNESKKTTSLVEAISFRDGLIWERMAEISVKQAFETWLLSLSQLTSKNYRSGFNMLFDLGIIQDKWSLQTFALVNHHEIINRIKHLTEYKGIKLSECTLQARTASYISFTRHLSYKLDGNFKRAIPCKEGTDKTFFKVREVVETKAMSQDQWQAFFKELGEINSRDCLIAKLALQGAKRLNEVLSLTVNMIDFSKGEITFKQSKTKGTIKETVISYPVSVMNELKDYIAGREETVFLTKSGSPVMPTQVQNTFAKAGVRAGLPFKATPHVLRASAITYLKKMGFSDSDIMKVSGHASAEMVNAYDKSSRAENASKKVNLI